MNSNINFLIANQHISAHVTVCGDQAEIVADTASDLEAAIRVSIEDAERFEHETYTVSARYDRRAVLKMSPR